MRARSELMSNDVIGSATVDGPAASKVEYDPAGGAEGPREPCKEPEEAGRKSE